MSAAVFTTASTVCTGLTNLLMPLLIQASSSLVALGAFALASLPLTLGLAVSRGLTTQTILRGWSFGQSGRLIRYLAITAVCTALATVAIVLVGGLPASYLLLAACCPIAIVQDSLRHRFFGAQSPRWCLASDFLWLTAASLVTAASTVLAGSLHPAVILFAYLTGGVIAIIPLAVRQHLLVIERGRSSAPLGAVAVETAGLVGLAQISTLVAAAFLPLETIGLLRSSQILLSGASMIASVITVLFVPRLTRLGTPRVLIVAAACSVVVSCFSWFGLVLLPTELVQGELGFVVSEKLASAFAVGAAGFAVSSGLSVVLIRVREAHERRVWLSARLASGVLEPPATISLAHLVGAAGLAAGSLISNALFAVLFTSLARSRRVRRTRGS